MTTTYMMPEAMKSQQWEITKGHLRASVALQGSYGSGIGAAEYGRWTRFSERVEAFIKDVEEHGLHE